MHALLEESVLMHGMVRGTRASEPPQFVKSRCSSPHNPSASLATVRLGGQSQQYPAKGEGESLQEFRRGGSTTPVFKPGKTQLINRFRILKLESVVLKIN